VGACSGCMLADELADTVNGLLPLREEGGKHGPDMGHVVPARISHLVYPQAFSEAHMEMATL
jgi:hypothetical protein